MAPRLARSSVSIAAPKSGKAKNRKRNLDAYATASHSIKERSGVKSHRLGEFLDDRPKQKRRRIVQDEDNDEAEDIEEDVPDRRRERNGSEEGSDSEGNEWRLGGLRSDDDDSELDSDEAFGESDEEKFEGWTFRASKSAGGKKKPAKKQRQVEAMEEDIDLDEGNGDAEDDEEDDFGDEGVDLATMLDDNGSDDDQDVSEGASGDEVEDTGSESSFGEDESDDQNDEERAARMRDRLEALDATNQAPANDSTQQPAALTVDDLLATLDPASRRQYDAALKTKKRSARPQTLTAPLPKRQQDRLNREVATEKAKEQLDRWRDTVIQNRRAEFLSFPLKHNDETEPVGKDKFVVDNSPQNELEANIQKIMEESGLSAPNKKSDVEESGLLKAEELATNHLPVEEVMRRRAELRQARELLFREEIKAKRVAKIKSKSYRRVHRRERARLAEQERELNGSDEDEKEKNDRKLAEMRMLTKHKDSKFAKALKQTNRGAWDEGAREAVIEEARRREELGRRIRGEEIEGDEDGSDVPSVDVGEGSDEDGITLGQLRRLQDDGQQQETGLSSMKFMKAADERRKAQNEETIRSIRKDLAIEDGDEARSEDEASQDEGLGRAIFGPKSKERQPQKKGKRPELEEGDESGDEEGAPEEEIEIVTERPAREQSRHANASGPLAKGVKPSKVSEAPKQESSGWLVAPAPRTREEMDFIVTEQPKTSKEKVTEIIKSARKEKKPSSDAAAGNTNGWTTISASKEDEDDASEPETTDPIITTKNQKASLMSRAFAADDTTAPAFAAEKNALVQAEDDQEESSVLPGWGSWTGAGLSKALRKQNQKKAHNPLFKNKIQGIKAADRKDAKLENVIISEKNDRKGKGYLAPVLPHEFETKQQYERSLGMPLGKEWVTKEVFQNATRPRVVVGKSQVVLPLDRPMV